MCVTHSLNSSITNTQPTMKTKKPTTKKSTAEPAKPKRVRKTIEQRNAEFWELSNQRKRILIARDIIELIKAQLLIATHGYFFKSPNLGYLAASRLFLMNGQEFILKSIRSKTSCNVCALGAAMVSATRLGNKFNLLDISRDAREELRQIFTREQLHLIEGYFETSAHISIETTDYLEENNHFDRIRRFKDFHENSTERLLAIWQNVLNNKGIFIPEQLQIGDEVSDN